MIQKKFSTKKNEYNQSTSLSRTSDALVLVCRKFSLCTCRHDLKQPNHSRRRSCCLSRSLRSPCRRALLCCRQSPARSTPCSCCARRKISAVSAQFLCFRFVVFLHCFAAKLTVFVFVVVLFLLFLDAICVGVGLEVERNEVFVVVGGRRAS